MTDAKKPAPPQISPYVFPVLLAGLGLWCLYDGWIDIDPEKLNDQFYLLFNRIGGSVCLIWAIVDFIRTRKRDKVAQAARSREQSGN